MARIRLGNLKGPKGDRGERGPKGEPFTYADFTPEQLEKLKWPKGNGGASVSVDNAYNTLLAGNVWVKDKSIDAVLVSVIGNLGKPFPRTEFTPLSVGDATEGQTEVNITGEPHYTVKVVGNDTDVFQITENGNGSVTIQPLGKDNVKLTYHNYMGEQVGEATINGVVEVKADEVYEDTTGAKFSKIGKKLVLRLTDYNGSSFNWLGKWTKADIDVLEIISEKQKTMLDRDEATKKYEGLAFIIKNPRNVNLETSTNQGTVSITTDERSVRVTLDEHMEWNGSTYESEHL